MLSSSSSRQNSAVRLASERIDLLSATSFASVRGQRARIKASRDDLGSRLGAIRQKRHVPRESGTCHFLVQTSLLAMWSNRLRFRRRLLSIVTRVLAFMPRNCLGNVLYGESTMVVKVQNVVGGARCRGFHISSLGLGPSTQPFAEEALSMQPRIYSVIQRSYLVDADNSSVQCDHRGDIARR